jgi:hypothetical protein
MQAEIFTIQQMIHASLLITLSEMTKWKHFVHKQSGATLLILRRLHGQ